MDKLLPNSFFGRSLQTGCKFSALVQLIVAFPLLILTIKDVVSYSNAINITIASGTFVAVQALQLLFAGCLFNGSKERNLQVCQLWAAVTSILTAATIVFIPYRIYAGSDLSDQIRNSSPLIILSILSLCSNLACLWVGLGFINVLIEEGEEGGTVYNTE